MIQVLKMAAKGENTRHKKSLDDIKLAIEDKRLAEDALGIKIVALKDKNRHHW
jgi:hypothetical protein